jgi:hypothetical protein
MCLIGTSASGSSETKLCRSSRSPLTEIQPGRLHDYAERTPDVGGVGWRADSQREHQVVVLPPGARGLSYLFLAGSSQQRVSGSRTLPKLLGEPGSELVVLRDVQTVVAVDECCHESYPSLCRRSEHLHYAQCRHRPGVPYAEAVKTG